MQHDNALKHLDFEHTPSRVPPCPKWKKALAGVLDVAAVTLSLFGTVWGIAWTSPGPISLHEFSGEGSHPIDTLDVLITANCGAGFLRKMAAHGIQVITT
jgi:hypothetical protein